MKIRKPIIVMATLFSATVAGGVVFAKSIVTTWHHNPIANSAIIALLCVGLIYTLSSVVSLWQGQRQWKLLKASPAPWDVDMKLKGAMSFFNGRIDELTSHDAQQREEIIHAFEGSTAMRARLAEYMAGLLIGLGLLGTFIGLMGTMANIGEVLTALNAPGGGDVQTMLESLSRPLAGMSSAFSASLLGLLGSLLMGGIAQFMSDANDNLVLCLRLWSQKQTSVPAVQSQRVGTDGEWASPVLDRIAGGIEQVAQQMGVLIGQVAGMEQSMASSHQAMVSVTQQCSDGLQAAVGRLAQVEDSLRATHGTVGTLIELGREQADAQSQSAAELRKVVIGMSHMTASMAQSRAVVGGTVQALADAVASLTVDGPAIVRKIASLEEATLASAANQQRSNQTIGAYHQALLELVRHTSAICTATQIESGLVPADGDHGDAVAVVAERAS